MKHSLNELTIPLGRAVNPRFREEPSKSRLVKSSSFHTAEEAECLKSASSLVKSSTFDSLLDIDAPTTESAFSLLEADRETITAHSKSENKSSTGEIDSPTTTETSVPLLETERESSLLSESKSTESIQQDQSVAPSLDSNNTAADIMEVAMQPRHKLAWGEAVYPHSSVNRTSHSVLYDESYSPQEHGHYSRGMPARNGNGHHNSSDHDVDIVDFEVTNSETETTVVLKRILAMGSLGNEVSDNHVARPKPSTWTMPSIEESDSEESETYYESEDIVTTPTAPLVLVPYTLPIPTVNLVDEDGTVLETILQGRGELTDGDEDTINTIQVVSDSFVVDYTPKTVYDESGPSTAL